MPDVRGLERVGLTGRPEDRGARGPLGVAVLPLIAEPGRVVGPRAGLSFSVWPWSRTPVTVGGDVFDGTGTATTAVAAELVDVEPEELVAVSTTTIVWPTSEGWSVYVWPVAPGMFVQFFTEPSQSCHWSVSEPPTGMKIVHCPCDTVSV